MLNKGDHVHVQGFGGERAILRVWRADGKGAWLCTDQGYLILESGGDAAVVGFPLSDILGKVVEKPLDTRITA